MSPAGRPPLSGESKEQRIVIRATEGERAELDTAAVKIGKPTSTWARDELLRLAREINGPAVKKKAAGTTAKKKPTA